MSDLLKTILLDEDIIAPSDLRDNLFCEPVINVSQTFKFKKRLIISVRKYPPLFDTTHEEFSNEELKLIIWNKIAEKFKVDVETCQQTWMDLRFEYQRYVRRLRKFLRYGNQNRKRRPVFAFESEMLFIWRFIPNISLAPIPSFKASKSTQKPAEEDDDIVILDDEEPVVIVLDDDDKNSNEPTVPKFKITQDMRKLIELVKCYPELYDSDHQYFKDYRRKGIIWNAIANESRDKATRLMKCWVHLQTRFEWELWHNKTPVEMENANDLRALLDFMREATLKNPNTVYKQSLFLKLSWHDPVDHFKNIFNLIALLKKHLEVINETESKLSPQKDTEYVAAWTKLARVRGGNQQPGELETTWLILRYFYWELISMRQTSYQLQDKWYFESIITDMYTKANKIAGPKPQDKFVDPTKTSTPLSSSKPPAQPEPKTTLMDNAPIPQPIQPTQPTPVDISKLPLPRLVPKPLSALTAPKVPQPTALQTTTTQAMVTQIMPAQATAPQIFNIPTQQQPQMVMPKIVSAKSLAVPQVNQPQTITTPKGLQIYQLMPQNTMTIIPQQHQQQQLPINAFQQTANLQQVQNPSPQNMTSLPKIASVHTIATMPNLTRSTNTASITLSTPCPTFSPTNYANTLPTLPTIPSSVNTANIPATIQPVRAFKPITTITTTQPVPVELVATTSGSEPVQIQSKVKKKENSKLDAAPPPPLQPVVPTLNQFQMPTLAPLTTQTIQKNSALINTQSNNIINANNVQINPINKENKTVNGISTLSRNEIMIELNSTPDGNRLVVHGPPLSVDYSMNMTELAAFIREVMAFPLLHNKNNNQASRVQSYWTFLSSKFNLPTHICRAIWNFLSENFNHFPKIAPMDVLMASPFTSEAQTWQQGTDLFQRFFESVVRKGWLIYEDIFPIMMHKIGEERCLYQDLLRKTDAELAANYHQVQTVWKSLRVFFGIQEIDEIWSAFKSVFWQYMQDIECGIENAWPQRLWRTFSKMEFLIYQRYNDREPYFYIVRNKFHEEIARCKAVECNSMLTPILPNLPTTTLAPALIEKANEMKKLFYQMDAYNLLAAMRRHSETYLSNDAAIKEQAWLKVAKELNMSVKVCRLTFQRALKNYCACMARDPPKRCRLNQRYYKHMHVIYRAVTTAQKINIKTPNDLNQSLADTTDPNDIIFPERMIMDINMDNADPGLVMKNWMYGIGNFKQTLTSGFPNKLQALFSSYEKFACN